MASILLSAISNAIIRQTINSPKNGFHGLRLSADEPRSLLLIFSDFILYIVSYLVFLIGVVCFLLLSAFLSKFIGFIFSYWSLGAFSSYFTALRGFISVFAILLMVPVTLLLIFFVYGMFGAIFMNIVASIDQNKLIFSEFYNVNFRKVIKLGFVLFFLI